MFAEWSTDAFYLERNNRFKLHKQLDQQYPPVLSKLIFCCWPDTADAMRAPTDPDEKEPEHHQHDGNATEITMIPRDLLRVVDDGLCLVGTNGQSTSSASRMVRVEEIGEDGIVRMVDKMVADIDDIDADEADETSVGTFEEPDLVGPNSDWDITGKH